MHEILNWKTAVSSTSSKRTEQIVSFQTLQHNQSNVIQQVQEILSARISNNATYKMAELWFLLVQRFD